MFQQHLPGNIEYTVELISPWFAEELYDVIDRNRSHLQKWLSWVQDVQDVSQVHEFICRKLYEYSAKRSIPAVIRYENQIVGYIEAQIRCAEDSASIDFWLCEQTYNTELLRQSAESMISCVFEITKVHRIEISCAEPNTKTNRILEQSGFIFEGTRRQFQYLNGSYIDHLIYSQIKEEWKRSQNEKTGVL